MAELEAYLEEMPLTDEMRDEVKESLLNLTDRNVLLRGENDSLRTRLKEYENRPLPREMELLEGQNERICLLNQQVQTLTSVLIDRDEVVERLRRQPKYLSDKDWEHLSQLLTAYTMVSTGAYWAFSFIDACRSSTLPAHSSAFYECTGSSIYCCVSCFGITTKVPAEKTADADG